jgi:hypothetical protein
MRNCNQGTGCGRLWRRHMPPRLRGVPRTEPTVQGAKGTGLSRTEPNFTTLGTAACHCGPGRAAGPRYTCITCLGFARIGSRIEARAPHRYFEQRRGA